MNEMKLRKHVVLGVPVLGALLLMAYAFLVYNGVFSIIGGIADHFICDGKYGMNSLVMVLGALGVLGVHRLWFADEFKGCLSGNCGDRKFKMLVAGYFVFDAAVMLMSYIGKELSLPTVKLTFIALMAGVCEEVTFRALPVSVAMRNCDNKKCIVAAVAVSSVVFGAIHSLNILGGGDVFGMIMMVVRNVGVGVLYAAIFLRTGNILITVVMHVLHDYIAFLPMLGKTTMSVGSVAWADTALIAAYTVVTIAAGVMLLRGHSDEIMAVWKDRWNRNEQA